MKRTFLFLSLMLAALFTSVNVQAAKVYYTNPNNWATVKAHFYSESQDYTQWPGTALTKSGNLWSVDIPAGATKVVFNNDNQGQQYPATGGLAITAGASMLLDGTTWVVYQEAGTIYFDNTADNWNPPYAYYWGLATSADFPGSPMTAVAGEPKMYKVDVPAGVYGIIFSDGAQNTTNKSADLVPVPGHKYQRSGDKGLYVPAGPAPEAFDVYFDNTVANWATPTIHYWGGATESTYPGVAMTLDHGKIYKYTVSGGTTQILFNAGDGDASKTADFAAVKDHVYTQAGDQGDVSTYNPTVEMPATLYILGTVTKTAWDTKTGVAMTKSGNTYVAENVTINAATAGGSDGFVTFVTKLGANWDVVNEGDRYGAPGDADLAITAGTPANLAKYPANVSASAAKSYKIAPGDYNITVDFENMQVTLVSAGTPVVATGAFIIPDVTIRPNGQATVEVQLNADAAMTAAQFYIEVPSFVTMGTPRLSTVMVDHTMQSSVHGNKTLITIRSEQNKAFARNNAELLYLPITASAEAAPGEFEIKITDIRLTTASLPRQEVTAADVNGKLTVEQNAASISLDPTEAAIQIGETVTITPTIEPATGYGDIIWATDNAAVATVANGVVTGVSKGTAIITATYGSASATCTVTVGKTPQTITWDQTFDDPIGIGAEAGIDLVATASSGLDVEFVITAGTSFAHIAGGKLIGDLPGVVTVQARQAGNDTYAPASPISKTVTVWLGYYMGDVNGDGVVTVADATTTLNYIHGLNPDPFNAAAADIDGKNGVTITDVVLITDIILNQDRSNPAPAPARVADNKDMEQFNVVGSEYNLRVSFTNMDKYIATQFDLTLPEGNSVKSASVAGSDHQIAFLERDGIYRMVVLSTDNETFAANGYIDLTLRQPINGQLILNNALINSTDGDNIVEDPAKGYSAIISGVENITANANAICTVYTIDGVRVFAGSAADFRANAKPGMYIIRTADKAQKVIIR